MMHESREAFAHFREHPAMYCGGDGLDSLRSYLDGYALAVERHGIATLDDPFYVPLEFHAWVAYREGFFESTSGWCHMIRERTGSDAEARRRFFSLLDEFRTRQPHLVAKLDAWHITLSRVGPGGTESDQQTYACALALVTYTDDRGFFVHIDPAPHPGYRSRFLPNIEYFEASMGVSRTALTIVDPAWNFGAAVPSA